MVVNHCTQCGTMWNGGLCAKTAKKISEGDPKSYNWDGDVLHMVCGPCWEKEAK